MSNFLWTILAVVLITLSTSIHGHVHNLYGSNSTRFKRQNCGSDQFQCKSGTCIDDLDLCDGQVSCDDGSDETQEACSKYNCPKYAFQCAYGACVEKSAQCNGVMECADGSDEAACGEIAPEISTLSTNRRSM